MTVEQQIILSMLPLTVLLLSAGVGLHWVGGGREAGLGHWVAGHLLLSLGGVIVAFRQQTPVPLPLAGAAGSLCLVGGFLVVRIGLRRFHDRGALAIGWWAVLAGGALFNILLFDVLPAHARIAINTALIAVAAAGLSREFLRAEPKGLHYRIGGGLSLFATAYLAFRAAAIAIDPAVTNPLSGGYPGAAAFLALIVWTRPMRW